MKIYHLKKFGVSLHWTDNRESAMEAFRETSRYGVELWSLSGSQAVLEARK